MNILRLTKLVFFLKRWTISLVGMWMLVLDSGGNDLSIFLRSNDVDLDVFHDETKSDNDNNQFLKDVNHRPKTTED